MTMREKLIEAATGTGLSWFEAEAALDAILTTLAEPDEGMIQAARDALVADARENGDFFVVFDGPNGDGSVEYEGIVPIDKLITAATNHVRSGK